MKKLLLCTLLVLSTLNASSSQPSFSTTYTEAVRGNIEAQYACGVMYEQGIGTDINHSMAVQWYEKAAIQGHKDAQFNLGIMYISGRGVEQNISLAMMWFASAAKQGDSEARKLLLGIIDNKYEKKIKSSLESQSCSGKLIKPIRFDIKEGGKICTKPDSASQCKSVEKTKISYTSNIQEKNFYKLTGIVVPGKGWKDYIGEGWIEEDSIEIRH
ncbi:MAG: tetratricopeptide repeat protein [Sulfuricurvum sp.]|uniref:tetratricopeptide repeat protein n=1 Tax=Sulfuricurvum sp. TaxID=2025608 RepID=UPI002611D525|nr:tetratricopeptide repeat protein [Sulfuricurvum sp.]MDD2828169.1 tetratricopeptide repeat protein [Sulfuricurvum sp.]MDD4949876.1 tetratricopeptide repeat protein [Sulfuricurvum sp.]